MPQILGAFVSLLSLAVGLGLAACSAPSPGASAAAPPPLAMAPSNTPAEPQPNTLAELLAGIEAAYRKGDYDRGLALVKRVFELPLANLTALDRLGSIYYVLGRYGEALTIWQRALPLEKNLRRRRQLEKSIAVARRTLGLATEGKAPPRLGAGMASATAKPRPPGPRVGSPGRGRSPEIDRLYQRGVKHYARGEYLQATTAFLRILEIDPGNHRAGKALERLNLDGAAPAAADR